MKRKTFNKYLLGTALALVGTLSSCEDYLTIYPTNAVIKEDFWNTSADVYDVRAAAYYEMTQATDKLLTWGELRSDNVVVNNTSKTEYVYLKDGILQPTQGMFNWAPLYKGINFCNEVLENGEILVNSGKDPSFGTSSWNPIKSEMIAQRALYYFYLVRAFRNVPYVTQAVDTDAAARASRIAATPGQQILDSLISSVEAALPKAAINYGNQAENSGRWTKTSMQALLSDMYLWRACMVYNASNKAKATKDNSFYVTYPQSHPTNAGDTLKTLEAEKTMTIALLKKSVAYADSVMAKLKKEYLERLELNPNIDARYKTQPYPLVRSFENGKTQDVAYNAVFGDQNSEEAVLELQYDGRNLLNRTLGTIFYGDASGGYAIGIMAANPALFIKDENVVDPPKGYGRTDFRYVSYTDLRETNRSNIPIAKGVVSSVTLRDPHNVLKGARSISLRSNNSNNAHWQIYRLADVMMFKAEAIGRLKVLGDNTYTEGEARDLINELFARQNSGAETSNTAAQHYCRRLDASRQDGRYANAYNGDILRMAYSERQREFLGEGKRWFDIVRQCEFAGETKNVLADWMNAESTVRNRLVSLWALYNPIYSEELKVNGKEYGDKQGQLLQNPVWDKYMPK